VTDQDRLDQVTEAMRDQLYEEVEKAYHTNLGTSPTLKEREEAIRAIDEVLLGLDVESMTTEDLDDLALELGLARKPTRVLVVDDRRT
jgi:hypothetical protein